MRVGLIFLLCLSLGACGKPSLDEWLGAIDRSYQIAWWFVRVENLLDSYRPVVRWRNGGADCRQLYSNVFDLHGRVETAKLLYLEERKERVPKSYTGKENRSEFNKLIESLDYWQGVIYSLEAEAETTLGKTATEPYLTCLKGTGPN